MVKNLPARAGEAGDPFRSLGQEDPLEEGMAAHPCHLAWRIPGTGEPGGLPSMGSHRVRHDYAWKIPWMEEPGGLQSMGSQRVGHD